VPSAKPVSVRRSPAASTARADAEVGEHTPLAPEQDVLRLDVAVDDAVPVGIPQRLRHFMGDPHGLGQRELGLARQPLPQRLPVHERHGEPEMAGRLAGIVHGEDVRVVETRSQLDLPKEPLGAQRLRQLGMENLQGDRTVVPEIASEVDRSHAAAPELALDDVAVGQGGPETVYDLDQVDDPTRTCSQGSTAGPEGLEDQIPGAIG
jgi:hypothetical protein